VARGVRQYDQVDMTDAELYRAALQRIAEGGVAPSIQFARDVLAGMTVDEAHRRHAESKP